MNLLVVVLDCLRLDYWLDAMPRSAAATKDWFHLDAHWSVAHCSDPNISTLLTGFGPWQSRITTQMGEEFAGKLPTLFWRWKKETGGGTWAYEPVKVPGFYRHHVDDISWHKSEETTDLELKAIRAMVADAKEPWCGFCRIMDTHYPYLRLPMPPRGEPGEIRGQYEQAVEHVDKFVSNLIDFVSADRDAIMVACSDHGELLGEHGEYDHLYTLYSILTRTPMAIHAPGLAGKRTDFPTQHIDLMPTLCDLFGWKRQGEGVSWLPWMRGEAGFPSDRNRTMLLQGTGAGPTVEKDADRAVLIDPGVGRVLWRHRGVVRGDYKLVENVHAGGRIGYRLTKSGDYLERNEYGRKRLRVARELYAGLPPIPDYHSWEREIVDMFDEARQKEDRIILERLKALGYA